MRCVSRDPTCAISNTVPDGQERLPMLIRDKLLMSPEHGLVQGWNSARLSDLSTVFGRRDGQGCGQGRTSLSFETRVSCSMCWKGGSANAGQRRKKSKSRQNSIKPCTSSHPLSATSHSIIAHIPCKPLFQHTALFSQPCLPLSTTQPRSRLRRSPRLSLLPLPLNPSVVDAITQ